MALIDQECEAAFDELSLAVKQLGLEWVQEQVNEQIRIGATQDKQLLTVTASTKNTGQTKRRTTVTFASKRPYSAPERLRLLVDAIEQAVVNPAKMEAEIATYFTARGGADVVLYRDRSDGSQNAVRVDATTAATRLQAAVALERLLLEIRMEI